MKLKELIIKRYSVRKFKDTPIEKNVLLKVLDAARMAPSAVNYQPWHFIVVQQKDNLEKVYSSYPREWIKAAPVVIIACADYSQSWKRNIDGKDSAEIDIAIAIDHLTLQAAEMGLGTCWVCNFDAERCAEFFSIPLFVTPIALIPIGYPSTDIIPPKKRKDLEDIIHWETFTDPDELV